jgi:hypothetical protein
MDQIESGIHIGRDSSGCSVNNDPSRGSGFDVSRAHGCGWIDNDSGNIMFVHQPLDLGLGEIL